MSAPPTSGPTATAAPIVAPQTPKAVARSRPWNSWAISAGRAGEHHRPADPLEAAGEVEHRGRAGEPAEQRGEAEEDQADGEHARRPNRSASDPAVSRTDASISE